MSRVALIDGDSAVYVFSYFNRDTPLENSKTVEDAIDNWVQGILHHTNADQYSGFLQGQERSHRHKLFESYKANRKDKPEWVVKWKDVIYNRLQTAWNFVLVEGIEVDDAIASVHTILSKSETPIICSTDKDYKQLAGEFYNPQEVRSFIVDEEEALGNLWLQMLTGDSTDNIKGIPGIGPKKGVELLKDVSTSESPITILKQFIKHHNDSILGAIDFAETAIQIILKRDREFKFTLHTTPKIETNDTEMNLF